MSTIADKRAEPRRNCFVPIEGKTDSSFDQTQTVDISRHGIGFLSSYPHSMNEKIAIEIQLKADTDPVLVIGIVKWVRKLSDSEQYRVGLTFSEVLSGSPTRLDRYFETRV
ncbi:MAG: PilZ domain-containing protein [Candidatus Omnitrophica bacterium]|nr:PilZ domain-containing protein [Candidatus Omnitrophota bacterium]